MERTPVRSRGGGKTLRTGSDLMEETPVRFKSRGSLLLRTPSPNSMRPAKRARELMKQDSAPKTPAPQDMHDPGGPRAAAAAAAAMAAVCSQAERRSNSAAEPLDCGDSAFTVWRDGLESGIVGPGPSTPPEQVIRHVKTPGAPCRGRGTPLEDWEAAAMEHGGSSEWEDADLVTMFADMDA
mmetsp:Transcript_33128/g.92960  ORF Transcript_33128/g.92960 Transcript_33128/m.92960 type:complete len:182 (+) Transcript_33128:77-622(+)